MFTITSSRTGAKQTIFNYVELSYHQVLSSSFFLKSCLAHLRFNFGICNSVLFCFVFFLFVIFSLLKKLSRLSHSVSCFLCMIKFFKFWSICVLWLSLCELKIWSVIIQQHSTTRKKKKIAYFLFCWFLHQLISLSLQCYWRMLLRNKTVSWSLWSQSCRGHLHDIPLAFLSLFLISKRRCQFKFCDPPKLYTKQKLKYSCRLLKKLTTGRFLF